MCPLTTPAPLTLGAEAHTHNTHSAATAVVSEAADDVQRQSRGTDKDSAKVERRGRFDDEGASIVPPVIEATHIVEDHFEYKPVRSVRLSCTKVFIFTIAA